MLRAASVSSSMREFLRWIAAAERTYDETMDAWRTSCPRLSHWEDASIGGLVTLQSAADGRVFVRLTDVGSDALSRA